MCPAGTVTSSLAITWVFRDRLPPGAWISGDSVPAFMPATTKGTGWSSHIGRVVSGRMIIEPRIRIRSSWISTNSRSAGECGHDDFETIDLRQALRRGDFPEVGAGALVVLIHFRRSRGGHVLGDFQVDLVNPHVALGHRQKRDIGLGGGL